MPQAYFVQARAFNDIIDNPSKGFEIKVFPRGTVFAKTFVKLKNFNSMEEAENYVKYLNSYMITVLLTLDGSRTTFASFVPDLGDYTSNNPNIDWDKPLDEQLYALFNFTEKEITQIESCT